MASPLMARIGARLKELRQSASRGTLTQETLASQAGISVSFLSMLERGHRAAGLETLADLADALSIPLDELFRDHSKTGASADVLRPLISFLQRRRLSRRQVDRLLEVARALVGK
ncbi:MAG: helix-turn-helix domain-containing protein [Myxococcales bacterium]